jgi:hypothetical protein
MEPGTPEALAILTVALEHSARLGHRYIGGEHLLLALVSSAPVRVWHAGLGSYGAPARLRKRYRLPR